MQKIKEFEINIAEMEKKNKHLDSELKKCAITEEEADARDKSLKQMEELEAERDKLKAKLEIMKDFDPQVLKQMKSDSNIAKSAISRWTG